MFRVIFQLFGWLSSQLYNNREGKKKKKETALLSRLLLKSKTREAGLRSWTGQGSELNQIDGLLFPLLAYTRMTPSPREPLHRFLVCM